MTWLIGGIIAAIALFAVSYVKALATAAYAAKQEEERKKQAITKAQAEAEQVRIAAQAEADRITIQAKANADAIALKGNAEAERYRLIVSALGPQNATSIEVVDRIKEQIGKIVLPQLLVVGGSGTSDGGASAVQARLLQLLGTSNAAPATPTPAN